ncbi:hypothetical protein LMIY3S_02554 [Labrys miyagiensis]
MRLASLSVACLLALTSMAAAQQPLTSYTARLNSQDHFNSNGERLTSVAAIIRQDRANYYVYGDRDPEDEGDSFFASKANRQRLETLLNNGRISASAENAILNGSPLIHVDIYDNFIVVEVD